MQPGLARHQLEVRAQRAVDRLEDQRPALGVGRPRLAQVPREQPVLEEPRQGRLHGHVDVADAQLERRPQRVLERLGGHEVAEPQPGHQRLGEGAEVEHPPRVVHRVQRLERPLGEPELAVVVVLDHRTPVPAREVEQRPPPVERERRAGRELVGRRREHEPGRGRQLVDDQPLVVDPDRHHPGAVRREHVARQRVAGLLDRHHVAGGDEHPGDEVEGLLGAVGDQHLVGRGRHAPREGELARDRLTQRQVAGRVGVDPEVVSTHPQLRGHQPPPGVEREQPRVGDPDPEVVRRLGGRPAGRVRPVVPARSRHQVGAAARRPHRPGRVGHERPRTDPRGQEALRRQPVVGSRHRRPRHPEVDGQRARRWQPLPRLEPPAAHRVEQRPVDSGRPVAARAHVDDQVTELAHDRSLACGTDRPAPIAWPGAHLRLAPVPLRARAEDRRVHDRQRADRGPRRRTPDPRGEPARAPGPPAPARAGSGGLLDGRVRAEPVGADGVVVADDGAVPRRCRGGHRPLPRSPPAQPVRLRDHREAPRLRVVRHARARRPSSAAQAAGGLPQQRHEARGLHRSTGEPRGRPAADLRPPRAGRGSGSRASTSTRADRTTATSTPRRPASEWASSSRPTCASTATSSDPSPRPVP